MSERRRLRWGVLGTAQVARQCVIPALQKANNGELRALASRSLARAGAVADAQGIAVFYEGYARLLTDAEIDAVYVPLPNHLHREWTLRAIAAGKHVLCEKPLALNAAEAREMAAAAEAAGVLLMEALAYRFHPRSRRIKELVCQGVIGDVRLIRAAFCFQHPDRTGYRFNPAMGGGALLDVGCYGVSLARWMMGAEPQQAQASAVFDSTGVDLTIVGLLRFPGEHLAVVEASFATALQQTYAVVGAAGAIELPHDAFIPGPEETLFERRGVEDERGQVVTLPGADQYQSMVEHFASAALGEREPAFPIEDGVANMRALDALAHSARMGHPVSV